MEKINYYDKQQILDFKKSKSINNLRTHIEMINLFAQEQKETMDNIDKQAQSIYAYNQEYKNIWEATLIRDEKHIETIWFKKSQFFEDVKHTTPLSRLDIIHANLINKKFQNKIEIYSNYPNKNYKNFNTYNSDTFHNENNSTFKNNHKVQQKKTLNNIKKFPTIITRNHYIQRLPRPNIEM